MARDVAVVDMREGFMVPCDWAEFSRVEIPEATNRLVSAVWLKGSKLTVLALPGGWAYERSMSAKTEYIGRDEFLRDYELIETKDGVETYRNRKTG
jgi:hypothetical protein